MRREPQRGPRAPARAGARPALGEARGAQVRLIAVAAAAALLSALLVAPAPSYDPWSWLLWGREVAALELSTAEGPAFKPLPVAVCALLSPLGGAAPEAWVILARAGAVLAVLLGFRVGRRLTSSGAVAGHGGSVAAAHGAAVVARHGAAGVVAAVHGAAVAAAPGAAGVVAAGGVALCGGFLGYAAAGAETGWVIAFALLAAEAWRAGRPRASLACAVACALLRVEAWPFLLAFGLVLWRRRPQDRRLLAACAVAVPALWFVPEWLGSGDLLRSGARARVPNPGQPALADVPALAALRESLALPLWPLWLGAAAVPFLARPARPLLAAGLAWIALVALMAQAGFSGEPRYSLPGGALVAIAGAAGLAALTRRCADLWAADAHRSSHLAVGALAAVALAVAAAPKLADLPDLRRDQAWQRSLATELASVIEAAGGRERVLACGRPYVGDLRGPLLAYHLDVEKRRVAFEPRPPGAVFRSRLHAGAPPEPPTGAAFAPLVRNGRWEVRAACRPDPQGARRVRVP